MVTEKLKRVARHLCSTPAKARKLFPPETLEAAMAVVRDSEKEHGAELRICIEHALPLNDLLAGTSARQRAIEVFSFARVWDTADNNGVLLYFLVPDHAFEIVADRGISMKVPDEVWQRISSEMQTAFQGGRFAEGLRAAVGEITDLMKEHFPLRPGDVNELPDQPIML